MPKFTYWVAKCIQDSDSYSIRERTKRKVLEKLKNYNAEEFDTPRKVTVNYTGVLDLLQTALGEGGPYWEGAVDSAYAERKREAERD